MIIAIIVFLLLFFFVVVIFNFINIFYTYQKDDNVSQGELGSALNQWQRPITEFGSSCDAKWVIKLNASPYIGIISSFLSFLQLKFKHSDITYNKYTFSLI
jgi:hypothetical protein